MPTRPLLVLWFDSIGHRLNYPKDELQEGDHLILAPGVHAGGADPWTIGASIAGIAQLILLVIDMWSKYKKNSEPDTLNAANTVLRPQETLKEARILLDNGQWVLLSGGRAVPENIRDLLNGFILPGSTAKPRKALFVLANGERVVLEASSDTDIDNVVRFFRLLGIPNAELSAARCGNRTAEPPNLA